MFYNNIVYFIFQKVLSMNVLSYNFFYLWLVIAFLFLLLEMGSPGLFYFLSFFFGGLAAAIATFWTDVALIQIISFFSASIGSVVLLRYVILPILLKGRPQERTNVYALKGKHGFVVSTITQRKSGFVLLNGTRWAARSVDNELIEKDQAVEVVNVQGTHVIVKKI